MARLDKWLSEEPRRPPAEIACVLARARFWKDERQRLIGSHRDWPDAAYSLELDEEFAHAFVLVLSRLPAPQRRGFADAFYEQKCRGPGWAPDDSQTRLAHSATVVLKFAEKAKQPDLYDERTLDLLRGAAQGDDLTRTPAPVLNVLRNAIRRIRLEFEPGDPADPRGAAALALAEVFDPSSGEVDLKEVLARVAWAAVETLEAPEVLRFLVEIDCLLAEM